MITIDIKCPTTCNECFAMTMYDEDDFDARCQITDKDVGEHAYNETRPDWCPIHED
jgi:hypothetical protein